MSMDNFPAFDAGQATQTHVLADGQTFDRVGVDPNFRWRLRRILIGRDQLEFADGTSEVSGLVVGLTANNELTTYPRTTGEGGGELDYTQPEILVRVLTEARDKQPTFGADGLPTSAAVNITNADGAGTTDYFIEQTFVNGLPSIIRYYEGTSNSGTLRAVKRLTFDSNGLPSQITIGAS